MNILRIIIGLILKPVVFLWYKTLTLCSRGTKPPRFVCFRGTKPPLLSLQSRNLSPRPEASQERCAVGMEDQAAEDKRQRASGEEGGMEPEQKRPRNADNADDISTVSAGAFTEAQDQDFISSLQVLHSIPSVQNTRLH